MATGRIKRVLLEKGFGFIIPDAGGDQLFFHQSSVRGGRSFTQLEDGARVEYEEEPSSKGPRAGNVRAVG